MPHEILIPSRDFLRHNFNVLCHKIANYHLVVPRWHLPSSTGIQTALPAEIELAEKSAECGLITFIKGEAPRIDPSSPLERLLDDSVIRKVLEHSDATDATITAARTVRAYSQPAITLVSEHEKDILESLGIP